MHHKLHPIQGLLQLKYTRYFGTVRRVPGYNPDDKPGRQGSESHGSANQKIEANDLESEAPPESSALHGIPVDDNTDITISANDDTNILRNNRKEQALLTLPPVPFSTLDFVKELERGGFDREVSTILMEATKDLMRRQQEETAQNHVSSIELDNENHLYNAALSDIQTSFKLQAQKNGIALRGMASSVERETAALSQKITEDMHRLKHDIAIDMNTRKEESDVDLKTLEMSIMDLNSHVTVLLGEMRTGIEATKWVSTRRVMSLLVVFVVSVIAYTVGPGKHQKKKKAEADHVPTVEELGVKKASPEADWWSIMPGSRKRVGEEEELP